MNNNNRSADPSSASPDAPDGGPTPDLQPASESVLVVDLIGDADGGGDRSDGDTRDEARDSPADRPSNPPTSGDVVSSGETDDTPGPDDAVDATHAPEPEDTPPPDDTVDAASGESAQTRRFRFSVPGLILGFITTLWIVQFGLDVYRRHDRFGSFNYDMGIYDQIAWLISHGKTFITVRGLDFFGHHANVGFVFTAPLYWLGLGVGTLNLIQVVSIGLGAVALYLVGRQWLPNGWWALVIPAAYLLHPSTGWVAWELFHPEVMALTPILFAWWLAIKRRWGWYTFALIWAVSWKEDVAIAVAVLGVIMMLRGRFRAGLWTTIAAGAYFVIVSKIISANVPGEVAFYANFYGSLGDSPGAVLKTAVTDPNAVLLRLNKSNAVGYARDVSVAFGLLPAVALVAGLSSLGTTLLLPWRRRPAPPDEVSVVSEPAEPSTFARLRASLDMSRPSALGALLVLMIGVPQFFINVLSIQSFTYNLRYHYVATVLAAMAIASIEILAVGVRRYRALPNLVLVATVVIGAFLAQQAWGISPLSDRYGRAYWPAESPRHEVMREAIDVVPANASVSATYNLVPHVTQREFVYEFPNPWRPWNWGVKDEQPHDGGTVDWLLIDKRVLGRNIDVFDALMDSGSFEVRFEDSNVVVAERVNDTVVTVPEDPPS
ncbi:MAG: DUF2079 domain-containing protein [Actinobacteria bacterium]|nr:DUF2079 domain-containing protein [Actinomycetota bacterium]